MPRTTTDQRIRRRVARTEWRRITSTHVRESAEAALRYRRPTDLLRNIAGSAVADADRMSFEVSRPELLAGDLTGAIIRAFFQTYNDLGSGFPEHIARRALAIVMREGGLLVEEEVALPVWFHGTRIAMFRADLIVAERVIVEVKASRDIEKVHAAQVAHYLKATDLEVGLLVNFGSKPQFQRVIFQNDRKQRQFEAPSEISS